MLGVLLILLAQVEPATKPPQAADVTPRTQAILARLEEPVALDLPELTFLESILESAQRAAKKGPNDPGIPIYVDPTGLRRAECTLYSTVMIPNTRAVPLKDTIARALSPLKMASIVKDDMLIISDLRGIERERNAIAVHGGDSSPETRALLARLDEPVKIPFPDETSLRDVLAYLEQVTGKPPHERAMEFLIVPGGLEQAKKTLDSTIQMDLKGVPLKTTLRLMLDQLGLACVVKNGRLVIHSAKGIEKLRRKESGAAVPRVGAIDHRLARSCLMQSLRSSRYGCYSSFARFFMVRRHVHAPNSG
jgi:hypothetical protein